MPLSRQHLLIRARCSSFRARRSKTRHSGDEEKVAADLRDLLHAINAAHDDRTSREVGGIDYRRNRLVPWQESIIHSLDTFLQQFEESTRANVATIQREREEVRRPSLDEPTR